MEDAGALLVAIAAAYGVAMAAGAAIRQRGFLAVLAIILAVPILLAISFAIPAERIVLRAMSMFMSTDLMFRLVDYFRLVRTADDRPSFGEFCRFLLPFPVLLVVFRARHHRTENMQIGWLDLLRVVGGASGVAAGFLLLRVTAGITALHDNFWLDHLVKVAIFLLTIESISLAMYGLERMAGFDAPPLIQNAFLSRTVASFWMRYNTRVHRWLYENVFLPSGGRRAPARGVILVFFVSALLHEVAFDIAISRIDGYQFLFFILQIPAVLASGFVERLAKRSGWPGIALAHALTIAWMIATSVFFFHGVHTIFPFVYVSESWLP